MATKSKKEDPKKKGSKEKDPEKEAKRKMLFRHQHFFRCFADTDDGQCLDCLLYTSRCV